MCYPLFLLFFYSKGEGEGGGLSPNLLLLLIRIIPTFTHWIHGNKRLAGISFRGGIKGRGTGIVYPPLSCFCAVFAPFHFLYFLWCMPQHHNPSHQLSSGAPKIITSLPEENPRSALVIINRNAMLRLKRSQSVDERDGELMACHSQPTGHNPNNKYRDSLT